MVIYMKKILRFIIAATVTAMFMATIASAAYKDVPAESPLAGEVHKATGYGLSEIMLRVYGSGSAIFNDGK